MAQQVGMTTIKRITYRGDTNERYSNNYWFTGSTPVDSAAWRALFDALILVEKACYPNSCSVVGGYGYDDNTGHRPEDPTGTPVSPAVWSVDLTVTPNTPVVGTCVRGTNLDGPGDDAVWVRWKTSRKTSPGGKAIYLRKYFHPALVPVSGSTDLATVEQKNGLTALGAKLWDGSFIDSRRITTPGKTDTIIGSGTCTYITTRTLKRRGKRPNS